MKKLLSILMCICLMAVFAGCTQNTQTSSSAGSSTTALVPGSANVYGLKGPTGVGLAPLMEKSKNGDTQNTYTFQMISSPEEMVSKVVTGEADIAALPTNLAATLYKKTNGGIKMLAVNTLGVLSILENGTEVSSAADLKGKTIYTTGQGSNPEYILRYILKNNNIDPDKDVTIKFIGSNDEIIALMAAGTAKIAMFPEPAATTVLAKMSTVRVAVDMNDEWAKISNKSSLMMGCVIVQNKYLESNPDAVKIFMQEYEESIQSSVSDVDTTASLCEKFEIIPSAAIAKKAIPNCNLVFVSGENMKEQITGYFQVLFDSNPASIGGVMPSDDLYYIN